VRSKSLKKKKRNACGAVKEADARKLTTLREDLWNHVVKPVCVSSISRMSEMSLGISSSRFI
jgi:hypothetical protein